MDNRVSNHDYSAEKQACNLVDKGNTLLAQGRLKDALSLYQQALSVFPEYARAHYNSGVAFEKMGAKEQAVTSFKKGLVFDPADAHANYNIGVILQELGKESEATVYFENAVSLKPDYAEAYYNLGITYRTLGKFKEALENCRQALSLKNDYAKSHLLLSSLTKYSAETNAHILTMNRLFHKFETTEEQKMHLAFGLGKAYEDIGFYEKAFDYFSEGNKLKRKSFHYSSEETKAEIKTIMETFSQSFIENNSPVGNSDNSPIFILGMPRSGTSLVEQIVASHPDVNGAGEISLISDILSHLSMSGQTARICGTILQDPEYFLNSLGDNYVNETKELLSDKKFLTNKMPHNFLWLGAIALALPNAKIISCLRSPMDNCLSIYKTLFHTGHGYAYDLAELGNYYLLYRDLMRHWRKLFPDRIYEISYEKLVGDQERETRTLLERCDLPWNDACLTFHQTKRSVATASATQVRRPIYKDSIQLWKRYEKQLQPLKEILSD